MDERDWFGVGTRLVGVVAILYGIWDLVHAGLFYAAYFQNTEMSFRFYLIAGWCSIAVGLLLVRSAEVLVNFAYGVEDEIGPKSQNGDENGDDSAGK